MDKRKILIICLGIVAVTAVVLYFIFSTEPTASSDGATKQSAMLVEVVEAEAGDFQPVIVATGTVQPVEDITLSPLVNGQVIRRSSAFSPGGFVKEGAILLQIDPSDFRNTLELRKSELAQAQSNLQMEMGRQEVAEQDLELAGVDSLSVQQRSLVLRKPQLDAVKANIEAARAAVKQGQLNLSRTTIRAPFDAHILSQNVTEGSQVAPGDNLGRLVGSENYWVILNVPVNQLQWLEFPETEEEKGSLARIKNSSAWQEGAFREGYLDRQVGALDDQTRLARVLIKVPDPLARDKENHDKPELMIGAFVEAEMLGTELNNVVRINRNFLRNNETIWVMENGKLSIREVNVILTDSEYAYISEGLKAGEKVVTTNLSTVTEGVELRTENTDTVSENKQRQRSEE